MVVIQITFSNTASYLLVKLWTASIIKYCFIFFLECLIITASKLWIFFLRLVYSYWHMLSLCSSQHMYTEKVMVQEIYTMLLQLISFRTLFFYSVKDALTGEDISKLEIRND